MASSTRTQVLSIFKQLHRTKDRAFVGDLNAINAARNKIREEFTKNKREMDPLKINELLKVARESEEMIRTKVIQAERVKPNLFRMRGEHLQEKCVNARVSCAKEVCTCMM